MCIRDRNKTNCLTDIKTSKKVLPIIVLSQFAGTSLWFVGNAVLPELKESFQLSQYAVSLVTSAVMLGFIAGTLVFAFFSLADRFSSVKLFFICSLLGACLLYTSPSPRDRQKSRMP